MEKGINHYILNKFGIEPRDTRSYSPLVLAYIGDGIYDLVIRSMIVGRGNTHVNMLHKKTSQLVKAHAQSEMIGVLLVELTEEEQAVYRRGRNAHSVTMAKNATVADYRRATGFEALLGYLYLEDRMDRLMELVLLGLERMGRDGRERRGTCVTRKW
ncbi:MAG: ribonuclease III [Lachnospiraceae bacterium]|nr:ribonuclease III [Lachnospiraceae bacterium]